MSEFSDWSDVSRLTELRRYSILDTEADSRFDRITELAADLVDAPIAFISFFDEQRQWFKSWRGIGIQQTSRQDSFFGTLKGNEFLEIADTHADKKYAACPWVTGEPKVRFFAGAPIATAAGCTLGALCVSDRRPRTLTARD